MSCLSLKLEPTCGSHVAACMESAFRIVIALGLAYAEFPFNDGEYIVYPDGRARQFAPKREAWTRGSGGKWTQS